METKAQPAPPAPAGVLAGHAAEAPAPGHVRIAVEKFAKLNEEGDFTLVGVVEALGPGVVAPVVGCRVLGLGKYDGFDHAFVPAAMVKVLPVVTPEGNDAASIHASSPPPRLAWTWAGAGCAALAVWGLFHALSVVEAEVACALLALQGAVSSLAVQRVRLRGPRAWGPVGLLLLLGLAGVGGCAARALTGSGAWTGLWLAAWWLPGVAGVLAAWRGRALPFAGFLGWTCALTVLAWAWILRAGGGEGGLGHVAVFGVSALVGGGGTVLGMEAAWWGRGGRRPWAAMGPAGRSWAVPLLALPVLLVVAGRSLPYAERLRAVDALTAPRGYFSRGWTPWAGPARSARKAAGEAPPSEVQAAPPAPVGPADRPHRPRWWSCYGRVFREVYEAERDFDRACRGALRRCKVTAAEGLNAGTGPCEGNGWWPAPDG